MSKTPTSTNPQLVELSATITISEARAKIAEANARTQIANANSLEAQVRYVRAKKELDGLQAGK